jgi:GNAT superfamily N-acetyltransferase
MDCTIEEKLFHTQEDLSIHVKKLWEHTLATTDVTPANSAFRHCSLFLCDTGQRRVAGAYGYSHLGNFILEILWVDSAHRRHGLGLKLFKAVEDIARKRGCEQIIGSMYEFHGSRAFFEMAGCEHFATAQSKNAGRDIYYYRRVL